MAIDAGSARPQVSETGGRFVSERVRGVPPSGIRKFFDIVATMKDVISLGIGEPDFVTPWVIREAAIYSLERGQTSYTSNYGLLELRQQIGAYLYRLYGVHYQPNEEILITVGVSEAMDLALKELEDRLPDVSTQDDRELPTLDGAMAYLVHPTPKR